MSQEESVEESAASTRIARKQEAKELKRKRIEESGGVRPRTNTLSQVGGSKTQNSRKNNKKSRNKEKSSKNDHNNNQRIDHDYRFGRVMDQAPCPNKPRLYTVSIAVPGSVITNAQTQELRTYLVGQIARAAAVYHVDEIIVFDDKLAKEIKPFYRNKGFHNRRPQSQPSEENGNDTTGKEETSLQKQEPSSRYQSEEQLSTDPHVFMARVLQYCDCPQYLRRNFFPMHPDLQFAGLLPPLDAPHHVRAEDRCCYREGIVLEKTGNVGSLVNCGIRNKFVEIDRVLSPGIRCTVKLDPAVYGTPAKCIKGVVVSPSEPREKDGTYWGFTTRFASSFNAIFDESPYDGGYDFKIGTSERGDVTVDDHDFNRNFPKAGFRHALIVFGGVAGIEECINADETIAVSGEKSKTLFDMW
jgi:hypothetical protein